MAARDPDNVEWARELARSYVRAADLVAATNDRQRALNLYQAAIDAEQRLLQGHPTDGQLKAELDTYRERREQLFKRPPGAPTRSPDPST